MPSGKDAARPPRKTTRAGLGFTLALLLGAATFAAQTVAASRANAEDAKTETHDVTEFTTKMEDISATMRIVKSDPKELDKMNPDLKLVYSFRNMSLLYKQPDKLRMEAKSPTRGDVLVVLNGATRSVDIPRVNLHNVENLEKSPGKRQSLLEFGGLLSPETLQFMKGRFVRTEKLDGQDALVFKLTYQGSDTGPYHLVWIDPKTHITLKREQYDADNKRKVIFTYAEPREVVPGAWVPTKVEVKSADDVVAATLSIEDIKVNQGLADNLFTQAQ